MQVSTTRRERKFTRAACEPLLFIDFEDPPETLKAVLDSLGRQDLLAQLQGSTQRHAWEKMTSHQMASLLADLRFCPPNDAKRPGAHSPRVVAFRPAGDTKGRYHGFSTLGGWEIDGNDV
jgi:hypothetical protein